jgi:hypothetical protein
VALRSLPNLMVFQIEAFFLHKRALMAIMSAENRDRVRAESARAGDSHLGNILVDTSFADAVVQAVAKPDVKSLRELLLHGEAKVGALTWEECAFYFKSGEAFRRFEQGDHSARAMFHANNKEFNLVVNGTFSPEHVVRTASAPGQISGQKYTFVFGYIDSLGDGEVTLRPLLIGRRMLAGEFPLPFRN